MPECILPVVSIFHYNNLLRNLLSIAVPIYFPTFLRKLLSDSTLISVPSAVCFTSTSNFLPSSLKCFSSGVVCTSTSTFSVSTVTSTLSPSFLAFAVTFFLNFYKDNNISISSCCGNMSLLSLRVFVCVHIPFTLP